MNISHSGPRRLRTVQCRVAREATKVALATLWIWGMATLHIVQQKLWTLLCKDALLHIMPHKLHLRPLHGYITVPASATNWLRMHWAEYYCHKLAQNALGRVLPPQIGPVLLAHCRAPPETYFKSVAVVTV